MIRETVQSANIKSIGYDEDRQVLEVEFHRGGVYLFDDVPLETYRNLMNAASIGKHFAMYVKGKFPFTLFQRADGQ